MFLILMLKGGSKFRGHGEERILAKVWLTSRQVCFLQQWRQSSSANRLWDKERERGRVALSLVNKRVSSQVWGRCSWQSVLSQNTKGGCLTFALCQEPRAGQSAASSVVRNNFCPGWISFCIQCSVLCGAPYATVLLNSYLRSLITTHSSIQLTILRTSSWEKN